MKNYTHSTTVRTKRWFLTACLFICAGFGLNAQQCLELNCPSTIYANTDPGQCSAIVTYSPPALVVNCCFAPTSLPNYTYLGTFNGHTYFQSQIVQSWPAANAAAILAGGKLVSINSAAENAFLQSVMTVGYGIIGGFQNPSNPNYSEPAGGWEWADGTPFTYTNWDSGQPDNFTGNEDRIEFYSSGTWNDLDSNYAEVSFVEVGCNITNTLISGLPSGSAFPVGNSTITYQATDGNDTTVCSFDISVTGNSTLLISCPADVTVNVEPGLCSATNLALGVPTIILGCTATSYITTNNAPSYFPVGTTQVIWTATDNLNNTVSCTQLVTVHDSEAPQLTCPANIVVNSDSGVCTAIVNYSLPLITENCCFAPTLVIGYDYLGTFNGHTYFRSQNAMAWPAANSAAIATGGKLVSINSAAENAFLQSVSGGQVGIIGGFQNPSNPNYSEPAGGWEWVDGTPFTFTNWDGGQPDNFAGNEDKMEFYASGVWNDLDSNYAELSYIEFGCNLTPTLISGLLSGSIFPLGTTTVTYQATDASGNTGTCSFDVTVVGDQGIDIICPANVLVFTTTGQCSATGVLLGNPTINSKCSGSTSSVIVTNNAPLIFPIGTTDVTWIASNGINNTSTCVQLVTVTDNQAPIPDLPVLPVLTGQCSVTATYPYATDNCNGPIKGMTTDSVTYSAEGTYTIHWTYSDGNGNSSTQNQLVIIHDATPPVITGCPGNISSCSPVVSWVPPVATDNCSSLTFTHSHNPGATFPAGNTLVTYTANDGHGNIVTCTFTVTVANSSSFVLLITPSATNVCSGSPVTLTASGASSYSWNNGVVNGVAFVPPTGTTIYTVTGTTTGGCTKTASITITVNALPVVPGGIDVYRCGTGKLTLTATVNTGETVDWYAAPTGGSPLVSGNLSYTTPNISATTIYYAQARKTSTGCTSSSRKAIKANVSLTSPAIPGTITGPTYGLCNVSGKIYSIVPVPGALSYQWSVPNGATITAGQGTTQITVTYGSSFGCGSNGQVQVKASNTCGTSCASILNVYTNAATPGNITGPVNGVCMKTGQVYSIAAVAGAVTYTWTVPTGVSIVGGTTTLTTTSTSVTVNFGSSFNCTGNITVKANNGCGSSSTTCLLVNAKPDMPSAIVGPLTACHNSNAVYSVSPLVFGATSYTWCVPSGAYITAGQGTSQITVHFGWSSGSISVRANNACGSSNYKSNCVNVNCRESGPVAKTIELKVYPNPSNGNVNIAFGLGSNEAFTIHVIDQSGRILKSINEYGIAGENKRMFDFNMLAKGVYLLYFESNDQRVRKALILQ